MKWLCGHTVDFGPRHLHWKHIWRGSFNSHNEQEKLLQQGKPLSVFIWTPDCCFKTVLNNCEPPLMCNNVIYGHFHRMRSGTINQSRCTGYNIDLNELCSMFAMLVWGQITPMNSNLIRAFLFLHESIYCIYNM